MTLGHQSAKNEKTMLSKNGNMNTKEPKPTEQKCDVFRCEGTASRWYENEATEELPRIVALCEKCDRLVTVGQGMTAGRPIDQGDIAKSAIDVAASSAKKASEVVKKLRAGMAGCAIWTRGGEIVIRVDGDTIDIWEPGKAAGQTLGIADVEEHLAGLVEHLGGPDEHGHDPVVGTGILNSSGSASADRVRLYKELEDAARLVDDAADSLEIAAELGAAEGIIDEESAEAEHSLVRRMRVLANRFRQESCAQRVLAKTESNNAAPRPR